MVSILVDEEIQLRTYTPDDAAELFRCINGSRGHLRPYLSWVDTTTRPEHSLQFIQNAQAQQNNQEAMAMGIFRNQRELIGGIGMHQWDHYLRKAQVGYWIAKDYEGKGIMLRCATRFIDFLFDKLDLNKVEMHLLPQNTRSAALTQKLGAKVEGVLRQSIKVNGRLEDVVVTGILRSEWKSRLIG